MARDLPDDEGTGGRRATSSNGPAGAATERTGGGPSEGPWAFLQTLCPNAHVQPSSSEVLSRFCHNLVGNATTEDFFGQYGQDWFTYMNFFRYMPQVHGGRGLYIDLGANHAFQISNTVFFDLCLNWRGVCIEPNPQYAQAYKLFRTCRHVPNCVWSTPKTLSLELDGVYSRLKDKTDKHPSRIHHRKLPTYQAQCLPLAALLEASGVDKSEVISLIDMDLEGVELPVLASFPFHEWKIMFFVIEWTAPNPTLKKIYQLMSGAGFRMFPAQLGMDVIFYHPKYVDVPIPKEPLIPPHGGLSHTHPMLNKRRGLPLVRALIAALQESCKPSPTPAPPSRP